MLNGLQIFSHSEILPEEFITFPTYTGASLTSVNELASFSVFDDYLEPLYELSFPTPEYD